MYSSLALYFALIDLLRSIHFGQASSLAAPEILSIIRSAPEIARPDNDQRQPQSDPENALVELVGILSRIHTVAMVFDPLFRLRGCSAENTTREKVCDYIPFSSMTELAEMTSKLRKNLEIWQTVHLRAASTEVIILWHFCAIYLTLPSLQLLFELSGYSCRASAISFSNDGVSSDTKLFIDVVSGDLRRGKEAVEHAWKMLQVTSDCKSTIVTSIWRPLALFSAALVLWANISIEQEVEAFASTKILYLFEEEIMKLKFPCSHEMSKILKRLQSTALGIGCG